MKNKNLIALFILIPALLWPMAKEGEDLQTIDNLIATTERQLAIHKELRLLITEFQKQQDRFYDGEQTKDLAGQMVQTATKILRISEEHQLTYLYTPFFVEELKMFAGLSKKKAP